MTYHPPSLIFDHQQGRLLIVDNYNSIVQVFSSENGSLVCKFGSAGSKHEQYRSPCGIDIDYDRGYIFITDTGNRRIRLRSLTEYLPLPCFDQILSSSFKFLYPCAIVIDKLYHRIIIVDKSRHCLYLFSSINFSYQFHIGGYGEKPKEFKYPNGIAVDYELERIIISDKGNNRIQVFSLEKISFLFEFGSFGSKLGQLNNPNGVCIDNQGNIIVSDSINRRLQAFTSNGYPISQLCLDNNPYGVACDQYRDLIAFSTDSNIHVIEANSWINNFVWTPIRHRYAPRDIKQIVLIVTMIRSLEYNCLYPSVTLLPNELLFLIFEHL